MSDDVPMTSLCSHPAINFNGNGVVDEHIVTSFANVLVRLWIPTLLCHYFVTACSPFFATWRNSVCPKQPPSLLCRMLLRVHCPSSGLSRLDGWGLCGLRVFWGWGTVWFGACLVLHGCQSVPPPNAAKSTSTTINSASANNTITATSQKIRVSREWVAVGGCWALGEDVSGNLYQLLDGSEPERDNIRRR